MAYTPPISSTISTLNSSTANLGIGGVFTGTSEDVSVYTSITISVFADQVSATDGLSMQQSTNGTNWEHLDTYTIPASTGKTFHADRGAQFFRLVYTNGGVAQTAFRIETIYNATAPMGSSVRPQDGRSNENDMREMLSHTMGYDQATNSWNRIRVTPTGQLAVNTDATRKITYRGRASTFRIPGRAGTAGQKLFSIHNATGSTVLVDVDKLKVDLVSTVVKAVTVLPPVVRLYKVTVLPTNGTAVTKVSRDSSQSSSASLTVLQDASADGTSSASALTATLPAGAVVESEFAQRLITAAGYEVGDAIYFLKEIDEAITLRPLEGLVLTLDYVLATQNPVTDMWIVTAKWAEYTAAA